VLQRTPEPQAARRMVQDSAEPRSFRAGVRAALALVVAGCVAFVALGSRARVHDVWREPLLTDDLDAFLASKEASVFGLDPSEAKSVEWADPDARAVTALSVVYLHGFSADRHEVEPLVTDLAHDLGANAYFARLTGHAVGGAALGAATVDEWLDDAAEAVAIGARIGERVVLIGTSTGGTLALWAASRSEAAGRLAALVLVSPNLGLRAPSARLLTWPWGGALALLLAGPERCFGPANADQGRHWTVCYPTRALIPMAALVAHVRGLDLSRVHVPTLAVYSRSDQVVDATETERILGRLAGGRGTETFLVEGSGDPADHVVAGSIMSPGTTDHVRAAILDFLVRSGVR
jgi:esterase/lipase